MYFGTCKFSIHGNKQACPAILHLLLKLKLVGHFTCVKVAIRCRKMVYCSPKSASTIHWGTPLLIRPKILFSQKCTLKLWLIDCFLPQNSQVKPDFLLSCQCKEVFNTCWLYKIRIENFLLFFVRICVHTGLLTHKIAFCTQKALNLNFIKAVGTWG